MSAHPQPIERPLRADARRNRERILAAARTVFAEQGADAQMDDVARAAGVGVGTVYRHFPCKEALMGELIAQRFATFRANADEALARGGDPWEAFEGLVRRNAEVMAADAALQHAIAGEPSAWLKAEPERRELLRVAGELIDRARDAGALREDFTVDDMPTLMCGLSATMGLPAFDWRRHLEIVLAGIRARP
jgi:AcrR family transcriptional regulator